MANTYGCGGSVHSKSHHLEFLGGGQLKYMYKYIQILTGVVGRSGTIEAGAGSSLGDHNG